MINEKDNNNLDSQLQENIEKKRPLFISLTPLIFYPVNLLTHLKVNKVRH